MSDQQRALFISQRQAFLKIFDAAGDGVQVVEALAEMAFDTFDQLLDAWSQDLPPLDCHKGCSPCCILRVIATAPEVLVIANHIRTKLAHEDATKLIGRIKDADKVTRGLGEDERMAAKRPCPFVAGGVCVIYPVRPLACRGHATFDAKACALAAKGRAVEIPISEPHVLARSFVQNPLHAALLARGLAWGAYEMNQALVIALEDDTVQVRWLGGEDVFAGALVADMPLAEMAEAFAQIG